MGLRGEKVTEDWKKLHNFIIGIANTGVIKSWTRGVGHVVWAIYRKKTISYRILMWKPEGKRPFGIPKHRLENKNLHYQLLPLSSTDVLRTAPPSYLWVTNTTETTTHKTVRKSIVFYILISMFLHKTR